MAIAPSTTMSKAKTAVSKSNGSALDFEAQLWVAAEKLVEATA